METHDPCAPHLISDHSRGAALAQSIFRVLKKGQDQEDCLLAGRVGSDGSALLIAGPPRHHERVSVDLHVDTMLVLVLLL